jgi:hypothetical protein
VSPEDALVAFYSTLADELHASLAPAAAGEITLPPVPKDGPKAGVYETAPGGAIYTAGTVARFLGWTKR